MPTNSRDPGDTPSSDSKPESRRLPPKKGEETSKENSGSEQSGRFRLPPMVMYVLAVAMFCAVVGLLLWLPSFSGNSSARTESNPFLNAKTSSANRAEEQRRSRLGHQDSPETENPAAESKGNNVDQIADADSNDKLDIKGSIEFIKMLKQVKKPSLSAKDLEQLQELINSTKGEAPELDIHNLAELRNIVREVGGPQAKTGPNDISDLQDLLHDMTHRKDPVEIADVDELRALLEDLTGKQQGIDTSNNNEVESFLAEIVPDESQIEPEEIKRLAELIDQISDKPGDLDVEDVEKFRKLMTDISDEPVGGGLQDVSQLTQMLETATGKQPTAFLDFVSNLKDEPGQQPGSNRRIELEDLPKLKEAVRASTSENSRIEAEDVDEFAALTQRLMGRPGNEVAADPGEMINVLKELTGKQADPSVDFVANVDGGLMKNLTRSKSEPQASDLAQLQKVLQSIGGEDEAAIDSSAVAELGKLLREMSRNAAPANRQEADALAGLLEKLTGKKVELDENNTDTIAKFLEHLAKNADKKKNNTHRSHPHLPVRSRLSDRDAVEKPFLPKRRGRQSLDDLPVLIVDQHGEQANHFATLNEALAQLPPDGAKIVLYGDTPFVLKPITVTHPKTLAIVAASNNRPVIKLAAGQSGGSIAGLAFTIGTLHLQDLHFEWDAATAPPEFSMINTREADIFVRGCSFTANGPSQSIATAITSSGNVERPNRSPEHQTWIDIHDTLIRGQNLVGLRIEPEHADIVIRNSLFFSGDAPSLQLAKTPRKLSMASRTLRLFSTTLFSNQSACEIFEEAPDGKDQPKTNVLVINSMIAADQSGEGRSRLLTLNGLRKPAAAQKLSGIDWVSKGSIYLGWDTLVGSAKESWASSPDEWDKLWNDPSLPGDFLADHLLPTELGDPSIYDFHLVKAERLGVRLQRALDKGWPGSDVNRLHAPQPVSVHDREFATRAKVPKFLLPPVPGGRQTIHIDVTKHDLGRALRRMDWPDGSVIIVEGYGIRKSSPIVVEGKSLRFIFENTGRTPLVLVPRTGYGGHHVDDAFISVKNGSLEILDGAIGVDTTDLNYKTNLPHWMIQVVDGNLSLQYFRIQGPVISKTRNKGLIRWVRTETARFRQRDESAFENYALLSDTFLSGAGTLISADIRKRALILDNVVASAGFHLMSLDLGSGDSSVGAELDLRHSTLVAAHTFFHVKGEEVAKNSTASIRCFVDQCVFFPTGSKITHATLLRHPDEALVHNQISWVGFRNGYGPGFRQFTHPESQPTVSDIHKFDSHWASLWGEHIRKPLTVSDGILFVSKLSDRRHLHARDFELKERCSAHSWGEHGRPIGAYVRRLPK